MMNIVTGGSGFIGINIVRKLISRGEKVRIIDITPPDSNIRDKVEYLNIDIRERRKIIEACHGAERIYHIVSLVPISKAGTKFWDVNVEGTRNIMSGALKYGIKKVVHMSSSAVCDINQKSPLDESSPVKPLGTYGQSKYDGEKVCQEFIKHGLDITIVRPRTVIGPERLGIFGILYDWISKGKNIYIIGSGHNKIQFIHVKELADACILMADRPGSDVFNIGTDRFGSLREDLEGLIRHAGVKSKVISLPVGLTIGFLKFLDKLSLSPLADWHYLTYHKDFYFDVSKAKKLLGWQPSASNLEMLIESYEWYINNQQFVQSQTGTTHRKSVKQKILGLIKNISG